MATTVMTSLNLKPFPFTLERTLCGLLSLARTSSLRFEASGGKKIKTDKPYGINGSMALRDGLDASGRKPQYGGYSPIYSTDDWSPSGDVYVGGTTGLAIWAVTLVGILAGGALLVYNASALSQ